MKGLLYPLFLSFSLGLCAESQPYFLCGPDEDGCSEDVYQYCACIPVNLTHKDEAYCLDFDTLTCTPLSETPDCTQGYITKNQNACLATLYQSEALPGCKLASLSFCMEHHTSICNDQGNPDSCTN